MDWGQAVGEFLQFGSGLFLLFYMHILCESTSIFKEKYDTLENPIDPLSPTSYYT